MPIRKPLGWKCLFVALTFMNLGAPGYSTSLGTGFTYQGRYEENGDPVSGAVHLRFSLWDAEVVGNPIGASQTLTDIPVGDGLFAVVLNASGEFGPTAFNGEERWLQIEVCADPGCSSLSILSPRQPVTGAPYALMAVSAPWSGLTDVPEGFADGVDDIGDPVWETNEEGSISYNVGAVGIGTGTSSLGARLQVNDGRIRIRESATLERWDLFYDPQSQKFYFQENITFNHLVFTKGPNQRVGIGTDTPFTTSRLHVFSDAPITTDVPNAVYGEAPFGDGVKGRGRVGVFAKGDGASGMGVEAEGSYLAGRFHGNVEVNGAIIDQKSIVQMDHPLDPANTILSHSSVESPNMLNLYNGNVTTDEAGYAEIDLPDYFEALNQDFRYQLTVIDDADSDDFVQAKVTKRIKGNQFTIRTSRPNVEVSWLVTGVRQDAYAKAHPIEVEKLKSEEERGKYLAPEVYGQPKEMGIHYRPETDRPSWKSQSGE